MASAAFFLTLAAAEFLEPGAECEIKGPLWMVWLCLASGFAGAGLAYRPVRGAAMGAGVVLVPALLFAVLAGTLHDLAIAASIGIFVIFGVISVVISKRPPS